MLLLAIFFSLSALGMTLLVFFIYLIWRGGVSSAASISKEEKESEVTPSVSPVEKKNPLGKRSSSRSSKRGGDGEEEEVDVVKIPKRPRAKSRGRR